MKLKHLILALATVSVHQAIATPVTVTMNSVSTTMTLTPKDSTVPIETGLPVKYVYNFDIPAGEYTLTAYGKDDTTVNGTIDLIIPDTQLNQEYKILTNTVYVTNKHADGTSWTVDNGDYTLDVIVNSREGDPMTITIGNSVTDGRNTFLALNGNSYTVAFLPAEAHKAEHYTTLYKAGTLTFNANIYGAIPLSHEYSISIPDDADLFLGMKFTHFTDFTEVEPISIGEINGNKVYTYNLAESQVYNYRTWKEGGLTQAGYFTMSADPAKRPVLSFTIDDYDAYAPTQVDHDVQSNRGYETGDIFLNINPQGHLIMEPGQIFEAHAMRTWQLTDNSTNNYFMEPDFHYTVLDTEGNPCNDVIEIDPAGTSVSPWSLIKAIGNGTVIVLVTYDAIGVNYYSGADKKAYMGGEYWGAIWPENTGVYVVTVGDASSDINPNMVINREYSTDALKLAGQYVDAEHDVFYYFDTADGAYYTFTPDGVENIMISYPVFTDTGMTYHGFGTEGVTKNDDGSYTLLLKHGRQIVKMTDASGKASYQVLTAKQCHCEITNESRDNVDTFWPGDRIKIQFSGLFHPANKLAGIYNMSAYVTFNGIPNGSSLILGAGQYTFGSAAKAQAVTIDIPEDYDTTKEFVLSDGVIQVNGYGDPIGNHRNISSKFGRSPNFTAVPHKTYFGSIPDVYIKISDISGVENVADSDCVPVIYYNLNGISSVEPFNGLNIVLMSDGSVHKQYFN